MSGMSQENKFQHLGVQWQKYFYRDESFDLAKAQKFAESMSEAYELVLNGERICIDHYIDESGLLCGDIMTFVRDPREGYYFEKFNLYYSASNYPNSWGTQVRRDSTSIP
jgi:hypothetical protein